MSTELFFTTLTALLAASLWIPYIIGVNKHEYEGKETAFLRPPNHAHMPAWVHRAFRAHMNLLEQFLPFAVLVVIGHLMGVQSVWLGYMAAAFFTLRLVHAVGMIGGWARMPLRPLVFTTGYAITMAYGTIVLMNA
ncbi:MAG: MAPEG family protein [Pseudomonadota bacterium]